MAPTPGDSGDAPTRSVERALALLTAVAVEPAGLSLVEAARISEIPVSTAARLLRTLESGHFLRRATSGVYQPGPQLLQLGTISLDGNSLRGLALPHLSAIAEVTQETAYLGIDDDRGGVLYLAYARSPHAIGHSTLLGRAIAAEGTIIGRALRGDIGEEGYFASRDSAEVDTTAAAAPIYGPDLTIVGALSTVGPTYRIDDEALRAMGETVGAHARTLSGELGTAVGGP